MATDLHLRHSKRKLLTHLAGCFLAILVCVWVIRTNDPRGIVIGWLCISFIGFVCVVVLKKLLITRNGYRITEAGIDLTTDGYGVVPWDAIQGFRVDESGTRPGVIVPEVRTAFVSFKLKDERDFRSKLSLLKRWSFSTQRFLGYRPPYFNPWGLTEDSGKVFEELAAEFRRRGIPEERPKTYNIP